MVRVKSSLIVILIVLATAMFFASCDNNQNQKCNLPDLYLQGEESVIVDSTDNWVLKTKKVVRYNSSCDSDSVDVKYYVKKGVSINRIPYTAQGQKANLDSLLAAQKCGVVVGPVDPPNGGGTSSNEEWNIPNWFKKSLFILGLVLLALLTFIAGLWLINQLIPSKRRHVADPPAYRVEQPMQQASAPLAPVTTGNPQIQSTCIAGAPGAIVIPPAGPNLDTETISITRKYYPPAA